MTQALLPTSIRPPNSEELYPVQVGGDIFWRTRAEILGDHFASQRNASYEAAVRAQAAAMQQAQADIRRSGVYPNDTFGLGALGSIFGRPPWGRF